MTIKNQCHSLVLQNMIIEIAQRQDTNIENELTILLEAINILKLRLSIFYKFELNHCTFYQNVVCKVTIDVVILNYTWEKLIKKEWRI